MPEIADRPMKTIDPDAHPHVLLRCLGKPADGLSADDATIRLHEVITDISDDNVLAAAADKLTNYCVPVDTNSGDRFEISQTCFSAMKSMRDRKLHVLPHQH
ncbi:MAG: hypothetical protein ABR884_01030 [Minisyncoccia bacterium]|jgi:hypothetical protein